MVQSDDCFKKAEVTAFVNDRMRFRKLVAIINREIRVRLFEKRERGVAADDILYQYLGDVLCNPAVWDTEKSPVLEDWLLTRFRNGRHNFVRKKNRHLSLERETSENGFDPSDDCDHVRDFENSDLIRNVQAELERSDDYEALMVFQGIVDEKTNKEIAEYLSSDVASVENAKKRYRRIADKALRDARRFD